MRDSLLVAKHIGEEEYNHFKNLCAFVSKYIEQNFSPQTSVVITADDFVVKEDVINGYFDLRLIQEKE